MSLPQHIRVANTAQPKTNNKTKSVSWPDRAAPTASSSSLLCATRTRLVEPCSEWTPEERASYHYSDSEYAQIKTDVDATVCWMESDDTTSSSSSSSDHCTRGLERQTQQGQWASYQARRDHRHAVLDECDRQLTCARTGKGGRFIRARFKMSWDADILAAVSQKSKGPNPVQQALERAQQDWQDIQEYHYNGMSACDKSKRGRSRIERTCSASTAETEPLSDCEEEDDDNDDDDSSTTSSSSNSSDPLWPLLHDEEEDASIHRSSCLDLIQVLSCAMEHSMDDDSSDSEENSYEDEDLSLPSKSALALPKHRCANKQQQRLRTDDDMVLMLPRKLFESRIKDRAVIQCKANGRHVPKSDCTMPTITPPEVPNRWKASSCSKPMTGPPVSATNYQPSRKNATEMDTGSDKTPPTRPRRHKSNNGPNTRPPVRPTRRIPRRTNGPKSMFSASSTDRPQRCHSTGNMTPNKLPQRSQSPEPPIRRQCSLPEDMIRRTMQQPPSNNANPCSLKHKYIIVDATCKTKEPPSRINGKRCLPVVPPMRQRSINHIANGTRGHGICAMLQDQFPHFGSKHRTSQKVNVEASKSFPFSPVQLQDDPKLMPSPWTWKQSVLDETDKTAVPPLESIVEALPPTQVEVAAMSPCPYHSVQASDDKAMVFASSEILVLSQPDDDYASEQSFHATLRLGELASRLWGGRQRR